MITIGNEQKILKW